MSAIKLCPLIIFAPGMMAGAEKVVMGSIEGFLEIGIIPEVVLIKESRVPHFYDHFLKLLPKNINVTTFISHSPIDLKLYLNLKKFFAALSKNHIIHTHGFKSLIYASLANVHLIHTHTHHGDTSFNYKVQMYEKIARFFMKKCHCIFSVSDEMSKELRVKLSPFKNIITIYNMLSFSKTEAFRQNKKLAIGSKIKILYLGRISKEKGIIDFIQFFLSIKNDHLELTIVGDGYLRSTLETLIKNHSNIHFVGFQPNPEQYLVENDILIMPSFKEGMPITLIESLSIGVPVIANNVGAIPFLITNGHNGLLINLEKNNFNNDEWKNAFSTLPSKIEQLKKNTLSEAPKIEIQFSKKRWAENTYKAYQDLFS